MAIFFFSCTDSYKRVGDEAIKKIFPSGVAEDFVLTYTETDAGLPEDASQEETLASSRLVAILRSPISNDFDHLDFPYRTFPDGLVVEFYDEQGMKSTITADYGIIYSFTNLVDLQGNVVVETSDGKKLESPQLYWNRADDWIFTQEKFKYTNPEEGTVMDGEGMDFNKSFSFLHANKTYGIMRIKENNKDD